MTAIWHFLIHAWCVVRVRVMVRVKESKAWYALNGMHWCVGALDALVH